MDLAIFLGSLAGHFSSPLALVLTVIVFFLPGPKWRAIFVVGGSIFLGMEYFVAQQRQSQILGFTPEHTPIRAILYFAFGLGLAALLGHAVFGRGKSDDDEGVK